MAVGGVVETKKIGLSIGTGGTFNNTFLDNDGNIKLEIKEYDGSGNPVYVEEGQWISDVIDLEDKFTDYEKVFTTHVDNNSSSIAIETRVSDNNLNWDEWLPLAMDGAIQSETKRYIQVKVIFYAGFVTDIYLVSEFDNSDDVNLFEDNTYIDTSNGLKLKREYEFDMTKDNTWSDEGSLHRKLISKADWLRIDKLNVISKAVE